MGCGVMTRTPDGRLARCVLDEGEHGDHVVGVGDGIDLWVVWNDRTGAAALVAGPACGTPPGAARGTGHCSGPAGHPGRCTWERA